MDIRTIMNLLEGSSIDSTNPSKKHGSDYDKSEQERDALEKQGVGKGKSIEDQKADRDDAKDRVKKKRALSEEDRIHVSEWLNRVLDRRDARVSRTISENSIRSIMDLVENSIVVEDDDFGGSDAGGDAQTTDAVEPQGPEGMGPDSDNYVGPSGPEGMGPNSDNYVGPSGPEGMGPDATPQSNIAPEPSQSYNGPGSTADVMGGPYNPSQQYNGPGSAADVMGGPYNPSHSAADIDRANTAPRR